MSLSKHNYEEEREDYRDYYRDYDSDDGDYSDYGKTYNFAEYEQLISVSNYTDNPSVDKITNIIHAMIHTTQSLECKEVTFKFNFDYGVYSMWMETAAQFNENVAYCTNYRILIDEESIVCICLMR